MNSALEIEDGVVEIKEIEIEPEGMEDGILLDWMMIEDLSSVGDDKETEEHNPNDAKDTGEPIDRKAGQGKRELDEGCGDECEKSYKEATASRVHEAGTRRA